MHTKDPKLIEQLALTMFSATGDGMHVEVSEKERGPEGKAPDPFITFREDEVLGKQVIIHCQGGDIAFSLEELKRAITVAESEVHKESFYD